MSNIFLGIITLVIVVVAIVVIRVLLGVRDDLRTVKELTQETEKSLLPVLRELEKSLESVRRITDNVGVVTDDAKLLSGSMRQLGNNVKQISDVVESVSRQGAVCAVGLKTGIKAALMYYLEHFAKTKKKN